MHEKTTFLFANRPYNKSATQASFEIKFFPGTNHNTMAIDSAVPIAFCDNMHVSLELTSAVSVIDFGF